MTSNQTLPIEESQEEVKNWFDHTYKTWGFTYLRAQSAYDIFATLINPSKESKHLDVACGLGLMLKSMQNRGVSKLNGIDLSSEAIAGAKRYIPEATVEEGNAEALPYEDNTFDSVTCIGSLERMLDRQKVLREQLRVTKQGATFCYMVRNSENISWRFLLKPFRISNKQGHQDALNLDQWKQLFTDCGFTIESVHPDHWIYYRMLRIIQFWKKVDTSRVIKFPFSIRLAYEFIFVLKKA